MMASLRPVLPILLGMLCNLNFVRGQLPCNPGVDLTIILDNSADVTAANYELMKSSFKEFGDAANLEISFSTVSNMWLWKLLSAI